MIENYVVNRWLDRGMRFFRAVTRSRVITARLRARGLSKAELKKGWDLYAALLGARTLGDEPPPSPNEAAAAMGELDEWDAPNFSMTDAVLDHRAPNAKRFLLDNLEASTGPEAVVAVRTFADRWQQLSSGQAQGVDAAEANEAVALLAARRIIDPEIAEHLRGLIAVAQEGVTGVTAADAARASETVPTDDKTFEEFRAWLNEWREVARSTFHRRDYLITLGLASRRSAEDVDIDDDVDVGDDVGGSVSATSAS